MLLFAFTRLASFIIFGRENDRTKLLKLSRHMGNADFNTWPPNDSTLKLMYFCLVCILDVEPNLDEPYDSNENPVYAEVNKSRRG